MFQVKVKTSRPWQYRSKTIKGWTTVAEFKNQLDAEKETAWVLNSLEDYRDVIKGMKVDIEIRNNANSIWNKTLTY